MKKEYDFSKGKRGAVISSRGRRALRFTWMMKFLVALGWQRNALERDTKH